METASFFVFADRLPLGLQVRILRVRMGLRQIDLARRVGVSQAEISAIECGRPVRRSVRLRVFDAIGLGRDTVETP